MSPPTVESRVHSRRLDEAKSSIVWRFPVYPTYSAMTHRRVGACQKTLGSRLPPVMFLTTGLPAYFVKVRPSRLWAMHCEAGLPAAV
ncbi:MAG: hypothetical protein BWX70_02596 [Verrucomicrobia bacterium ADurb.Bin070]|nr:MAG: hypothetical protein BWX70_02596 [Verrucomicrobia bacterium ADurb.Bin070]